MEVSDGSVDIDHKEKCRLIERLTKYGTVLSEVGSKDAAHIIPPYKWIELMRAELNAGAPYVIAEAREAGNVGIYRGTGEVREGLVQEILTQIPAEKILWEAPQKSQQLYFIELVGANVNLGNIAPNEMIALEAMRIGLRGDTFDLFLDKNRKKNEKFGLIGYPLGHSFSGKYFREKFQRESITDCHIPILKLQPFHAFRIF